MSNLLDNVASAVGGLENLPDHQLLEFATRCGMEFSIREETRASLRCLRMILDGIQTGRSRARSAIGTVASSQPTEEVIAGLVASGLLIPGGELAKALNFTRQAVHKGRSSGRYFALMVRAREHYYPTFFTERDLRDAGLEEVLEILKGESPWAKWTFFSTPSLMLSGLTPIDAIRKGMREKVLIAARCYLMR